ncbi:MAG: hypothetical protein HQL63_10500 [Magnetococcales bacterium]|nr:hypothetical protein [Magnetococcales bacterium]MBF0322062.1 hypothetical protein [Magnetococcales bacterium]
MMGLKDYLAELRYGRALPFLAFPPERPLHLEKAVLDLGNLEGKPPKEPPDLDKIEHILREATDRGTLGALTHKTWREAPWCLWRGDKPWLAETPFMDDYLNRLKADPRRTELHTLIHIYLQEFASDKPGFRLLAGTIAGLVVRWEWKWRTRQENDRLFDPEAGPKRLCAAIMARPDRDFRVIFAEAGLPHVMAGGFAATTFALALEKIHHELTSGSMLLVHLQQFFLWAETDNEGLRYPRHNDVLAKALLLPFRGRDPDEAIKQAIRNFLVERFGDPRTSSHSKWNQVEDNAKEVILRWLLRFSLEQFIAIVKEFADQKEPDQWKYRETFWMAYFNKGYIREAWVVLARDPAHFAERKSKENNDKEMSRFGCIVKGVSPQHAVLLMKVDNLIIADWSFNGKCRIWRVNDSSAPRLYQEKYDAEQLKNQELNNMAFIHTTSRGGRWQSAVANRIRELTGISLRDDAYMPD